MTDKFQNKFRIPSARLQNWDYRWAAAYFVTICTQNREHFFGEIADNAGYIQLTNTGILADVFWHEIKNHAQNIELGEFVVMPNHIHGIVIINNNDECNDRNINAYHNDFENTSDNGNDNGNGNGNNNGNGNGNVETRHALSLQPNQPNQPVQTIGQQRFQNQGKNSLSSIIGSYKSVVTRHANRLGLPFAWQSRFYDHIIRDAEEFERIQNYIANNPKNWNNDKFYE